jgi:hypothetical protein
VSEERWEMFDEVVVILIMEKNKFEDRREERFEEWR